MHDSKQFKHFSLHRKKKCHMKTRQVKNKLMPMLCHALQANQNQTFLWWLICAIWVCHCEITIIFFFSPSSFLGPRNNDKTTRNNKIKKVLISTMKCFAKKQIDAYALPCFTSQPKPDIPLVADLCHLGLSLRNNDNLLLFPFVFSRTAK